MKKIIWILFLLGSAVVCIAQTPGYPVNLRNVIIGYQTTPEGLFFRGSHSPNHIPLEKYGTFMYVDTVTRQIWMYLDKDIVNGQPVGVWAKMYPSVSDLSSLTDVNTTGKTQNSMLIYDALTSKWIIDNGTVYRRTSDALSGEVYGAYNDTKLGTVSALSLNLTPPSGALSVGMLSWDATTGTASLGLLGGNVQLKVGQQLVKRVVNKTTNNANLLKSEYKVVKLLGASGSRISVDLAQANNEAGSAGTLGVVIEDINNNQEGFILVAGEITNINTTGDLVGETWNQGDVLYLSATTPGALTKVKPTPPDHTVIVGWVESVNANNGKIYVKIDNGYELEELHNVLTTDKTNGSILYYDNGLWKASTGITLDNTGTLALNAVTANTLMYVDGNNKLRSVTLTTTGSSGAATFSNGTLNIPMYAGSTDLTFDGTSSPVTLNSSTGTDVTFTAGTNISLSQINNNLTINSTATSSNIYNSNGSIPVNTTRTVTLDGNSPSGNTTLLEFKQNTGTGKTTFNGGSILIDKPSNTAPIDQSLEVNALSIEGRSVIGGVTETSGIVLAEGAVELRSNAVPIGNAGSPALKVNADNTVSLSTLGTVTSASGVRSLFREATGVLTDELVINGSSYPALNRLLPSQASNANKYLKTNGTDVSWETVTGGGTITGTGAANKVAFWTDGTTLSSNSNFHWNNTTGRLGIGTDAPASFLHLRTTTTLNSNQWLRFQYINAANSSDNAYIGVATGSNAVVFNKSAGTLTGNTATTFQFYNCGGLNNDGFWNGVQFWGHSFTENGSNQFPKFTLYSNSTTATDPSVYNFNFELGNTGNTPGAIRFASPTNTGSYINFNDLLYATTSSKVGIGTIPTSTDSTLTVAGGGSFTGGISSKNITFSSTSTFIPPTGIYSSANNVINFSTNGSSKLTLNANGVATFATIDPSQYSINANKGIRANTVLLMTGTTNSTPQIQIKNEDPFTSGGYVVFQKARGTIGPVVNGDDLGTFSWGGAIAATAAINASVGFRATVSGDVTSQFIPVDFTIFSSDTYEAASPYKPINVNRLTVKPDGKIGIGTTSPQNLLHVAGSFRVDDATLSANPGFNATRIAAVDDNGRMRSIAIGSGLALNTTTHTLSATGGTAGTVTVTGTPAVGQIAVWSGTSSIQGVNSLDVAKGGTGATDAATARSNLGLVIGTNVLAPNGSANSLTNFPTLNQNTTGSAATLTTARNIQTNLALTTAASFNGSADVTPGVTGVLSVANGGTGLSSYTVGDLIQATGSTTLSRLASVASGNVLLSGGVTTASSWGKVGLTTHITGTLPIANGGTNTTTAPTAGQTLIATNGTTYTPITPSTHTGSSNTSITWDVNYRSSGVYRISNTSTATITGVTVSNVVTGGIYAFHISGASNTVTITVQWPAGTFKDLTDSTDYGTRVYTTPTIITCYYDGANFVCE